MLIHVDQHSSQRTRRAAGTCDQHAAGTTFTKTSSSTTQQDLNFNMRYISIIMAALAAVTTAVPVGGVNSAGMDLFARDYVNYGVGHTLLTHTFQADVVLLVRL